jgi:putative acetyltransferase
MQIMQSPSVCTLRPLQASDVHLLAGIIDDRRRGYGLFETYRRRRAAYFVAVVDERVIGGAGIAPLPGEESTTCELQRMYVHPDSRGRGVGHALLQQCRLRALQLGYRQCYAQTTRDRADVIACCERSGFNPLTAPLGEGPDPGNDYWLLLSLLQVPGGAMTAM